ncbi:hypothetical protein ACFXBB_06870 [Streptomyces scopuliridis]|uniref:hypothetical protein n=1 Tax=Streptomyces scopuliridis TaxID=452529 RepID=UPI003674EA59
MSFDQEWADLKQSAATRMRLNSLPTLETNPTPTRNEDLIVNDDELGKIGHAAYVLHRNLTADGKHAQRQTETAGESLKGDGFATGAALTKFSQDWKKQMNTLLEGCAHISNHLDYSSKSMKKEDEQIETSIRASKISEYLDVPSTEPEPSPPTPKGGPII